mmetsp:Transcript_17166/g.26015  ORF Transcript_17166/g.26015 Transcript_17166/m.26015 type:complete len:313 (-) Transcript_17166:24-962(-)
MLSRFLTDRRCWQYWTIHLFPIVVIFISFILSAVSTDSCEFLLLESAVAGPRSIGLFRFSTTSSTTNLCSTWSFASKQGSLGGPLVASQAFSVMTCILGITSAIMLFVSFYWQRFLTKNMFRITIPSITITAGVFQLFTFLIFADDSCKLETTQCSMLVAGRQSLCAALMYLGMGIGLIWYPKLERPLLVNQQVDGANTPAVVGAPSMEEVEALMQEGEERDIDSDDIETPEPVVAEPVVEATTEKPDPVSSREKKDVTPSKQQEPGVDDAPVKETVKTTMLPDGKRRIEKTVYHPSGSKTTTVTTQEFGTY